MADDTFRFLFSDWHSASALRAMLCRMWTMPRLKGRNRWPFFLVRRVQRQDGAFVLERGCMPSEIAPLQAKIFGIVGLTASGNFHHRASLRRH